MTSGNPCSAKAVVLKYVSFGVGRAGGYAGERIGYRERVVEGSAGVYAYVEQCVGHAPPDFIGEA